MPEKNSGNEEWPRHVLVKVGRGGEDPVHWKNLLKKNTMEGNHLIAKQFCARPWGVDSEEERSKEC